MANSQDTVLISGGGISGLTLACALRRHDIPVELVERKSDLSDDGGVGLSLVGNALRALDSIGIARALIALGLPADHLEIATPEGRVVARSSTDEQWGDGIPGHCSISRPALHRLLAERARNAGVRIRTGLSIASSTPVGDCVEVGFSDGGSARYRLCVAAEGLHSATRERLFPGLHPAHSGQACWRARVPRPAGLLTTRIHFGGRLGVVGICPISRDDAYLYVVEAADARHREDETRTHLALRERLTGHYGGLVADLLEHLTDPAQVSYRPLPVFLLPAPWYRDGVVFIGDAAHANPPVLAQGAAMGIEDAVVLAEELASAPASLDAALAVFMARRFERVRNVVETSRDLARWQVEQRRDVDIGGTMKRVAVALTAPI
ncbi:FAD-dependent monooxygenase [Derxia lacustris]|uniref:FAD-dependent monooxygenase n=1 Tax=Derxia lacustris TaxID=764842 RepID=UPI0015940634|nr:FAD-dependent monooxygenase [Derxia lacustris]